MDKGLIFIAVSDFIIIGCGILLGGWFGCALILFAIIISILGIQSIIKNKKWQEQYRKQEEEKRNGIEKLNQRVKSGEWEFPSEKFYRLCQDGKVSGLNDEFSMQKAIILAKQVITEADGNIDLSNCEEYLKKESLEGFLKKGESLANKANEKIILEQKQPRNANPSEPEKTFIKRASELPFLSGCDKRVKMLSNLSEDYDKKYIAMLEGEEALRKLGMIYAGQQQRETSWAVMGGLAEGIAGPAAGIMAASNTMANNQRIREHNESVRKASMDIMSGIPSLTGDRNKLEEEWAKIRQQRNEAHSKVVLTKPATDEIWRNIRVGKATVKKNPSGVLKVSVPLTLKAPFVLDVPENVHMVVDGVLRAEVWFEDKYVDNVYFPLPIYGIPTSMTAEVTLDGMCGRSVEFDGEYTVKIADTQNFWIMEA
ncbi:MAG: hypothetical protein ACI4TK_12570 [Agathobacter sp.]